MKTVQVRRLKDLERENGRLKKAFAELSLDTLILKEALGKTVILKASMESIGMNDSTARFSIP